jgi:Zn-dependent alcohol dehydrogenase
MSVGTLDNHTSISVQRGKGKTSASRIIRGWLDRSEIAACHELSCTDTVQAADPHLVQRVKDLTSGGIDFASEVIGAKSAFKTTRNGGESIGIEFGWYEDQCPYASLVGHAKEIRGSMVRSAVADRDIPCYLQYNLEGMCLVDRLASGFRGAKF